MTRPSDPGRPYPSGGPVGPEPPHQQDGRPYVRPPGPAGPGPQAGFGGSDHTPRQGWSAEGYGPQARYVGGSEKGFLGSLLDTNFDFVITPKLIRLFYRLALAVITIFALGMLMLAWSFADWNMALGIVTLLATPILWIFNVVIVRMFLEFLINQFKITEHLRTIKDKILSVPPWQELTASGWVTG
jgi:hypothetical protein